MRHQPYRQSWTAQTDRGVPRNPSRYLRPVIVIALIIAGLCFVYIWQAHRLWQLTAAVNEAQQAVNDAQAINRVLSLRIEEAFSLERIARLARDRLGMAEPSPVSIRYVELFPTPVN